MLAHEDYAQEQHFYFITGGLVSFSDNFAETQCVIKTNQKCGGL